MLLTLKMPELNFTITVRNITVMVFVCIKMEMPQCGKSIVVISLSHCPLLETVIMEEAVISSFPS